MIDASAISSLDTHPRLQELDEAAVAAFVASSEGQHLLWANAAASGRFETDTLPDAVADQIALVAPFILRSAEPSPVRLRIADRGMNFHAERIEGEGFAAVLFTEDAAEQAEPAPQVETASTAESGGTPPCLPARFVWQSDESGRIVRLSDEVASLGSGAEMTGRSWDDLCAEYDLDRSGRLAAALARRDTWSGVTINWPLGGDLRQPVELAGLPVFDRDRNFLGFRGFGVVRDEPFLAPNVVEPEAPAEEPAEPAPAEWQEPESEPPVLLAAPILPFRTPSRPGLKPNEHSAFREIGRTLGAPTTQDNAPAEQPQPQEPSPPATPRPALPEAVAGKLALSEEDGALQALSELPAGILIHRLGVPLFANRAFLELVAVEDLSALAQHGLDHVFEERTQGPGLDLRSATGRVVPVRSHLKTIRWQSEPASLLFVTPEEAVPAQPASGGSERELRAILDTATDGVVVLDGNGRIVSTNRSAEALFGFEAAELEGRSFTLLLAADSHRAALDYLDGLKSNGVASVLNDGREVIGIARRGGVIPLFMTLGRVGEGAEPRFCAVLRDITQFRQAEEELRSAKLRAERANAQKSDFLARISHEIRTPLNAILGFAEVMMEERFGPLGTSRYKDYLKDIHESGGYIISLVNDLLDLSKIEAGKLDLSFTGLNLNEIVASSVSMMQPQANQDRIIIRTSLAPRLPAVVGDLRSLKQIVLNLVSNAVKYTPAGGQVIVSTALTDLGQAVIRVRDTGVGMHETEIATALEPFRQLSTASGRGGTGLGLPLTKALVEANRATFAIQSAVGTGTLVEVIFPPTRVLSE